jgi:dihydroflavonol-4-reductase
MKTLVTGANGHLGFHMTKALLARGYDVRATVRSLAAGPRNQALRALGPVELVQLDVRDADTFRRHCEGIDVLYHLAATYAIHTGSRTTDEDIIKDSMLGAENAILAAAGQVGRVAMTSSIVTLPMTGQEGRVATEADWRTDLEVPYNRAKTLAEQRAWELADRHGVKLVTLLPAAIGGPGFFRRTPTTDFIEGMMMGSMALAAPRANMPYVDVRDVAEGHILAAESNENGRFILANDDIPTFVDYAQVLHDIDPKIPTPKFMLPDFVLPVLPYFEWINRHLADTPQTLTPEFVRSIRGRSFVLSSARAHSMLGWQPKISFRQSLADTAVAIRALRRSEGKKT